MGILDITQKIWIVYFGLFAITMTLVPKTAVQAYWAVPIADQTTW